MSTALLTQPLRVVADVRCLVGHEVRGFARYTTELLTELARLPDLDLVLVSNQPVELPGSLEGLDIHFVNCGREWNREQRGIPRLVSDIGGDVLFAPANRGLPLFGGPSVLTLHDGVEWDPDLVARPRGKDRVRFGYSSVASLLSASLILTVSAHAAGELQRRLGLGPERVRVVSEAVGAQFTEPCSAEERKRLRDVVDLPERYVLYLGGFDQKKSVHTLVEAWARRGLDNVPPLVLAGAIAADTETELVAKADQCGGDTSRLIFTEYVDDGLIKALYAEADLFVYPAIAEGFGLPPVEAMAAGTATVVADAASLPEATRGVAVRFAPGDAAALGIVMQRLLSDSTARSLLAEQCRLAVSDRTWADVASDTEAVLREAAEDAATRRLARSVRSIRHSYKWVR